MLRVREVIGNARHARGSSEEHKDGKTRADKNVRPTMLAGMVVGSEIGYGCAAAIMNRGGTGAGGVAWGLAMVPHSGQRPGVALRS
jgi:hypothetical protein